MTEKDQEIDAVGSLSEPSRRALYRFVAGSRTEVSRDQAAKATGLSRMLAAFHLDRLVNAGLLETTFRRVSGRTGPGAGRPAKLYRRSGQPIRVSLPEQRYDLLARLFADAVERAGDGSARKTLGEAAHELGRTLAAESHGRLRAPASRRVVSGLLQRLGFEPYLDSSVIRLRNCPFAALANQHRELTCSTNLCLMEGVLEGLGHSPRKAQLDPLPDRCCVIFEQLSA